MVKKVLLLAIRFYQLCISPHFGPCCRFTPTCSAYAIEAFTKRGFFVGLILTVWRLLRCNPFSKGGYDPVPERGFRNRKSDLNISGGEETTGESTNEKENT